VLEPCLKVAAAGLDHGARFVPVGGKPLYGFRGKVVENGEAVLTGWPDVDVRAPRIVGLQERNAGKNSLSRMICKAGKQSAFASDAEVVGLNVESGKHPFDSISGSIHTASFSADLQNVGNWCYMYSYWNVHPIYNLRKTGMIQNARNL
jgi:hypothetical protein